MFILKPKNSFAYITQLIENGIVVYGIVTGDWQGGGIDHENPEKPATLEDKKSTIPKLKFSNSVYQKFKKLPEVV
jgi:hypothetical protein